MSNSAGMARYGNQPLAKVLAGPIKDVMLVLYPIEVQPMGQTEAAEADPHELRPVRRVQSRSDLATRRACLETYLSC